jgi:predicted 3-demethylubiquinone-9 3-methyltransferase (glyoxalase superfamily)
MILSVVPFMMFEGKAEEAMSFYVSVVPDSRVTSIERWTASEPGKEGAFKSATFVLSGQTIRCFDSPAPHGFTFTPSISLFITCSEIDELDRLAAAFEAGGKLLMPPGSYGFSRKFAWVQDRYGVSWQINCE